MSRRRVVQAATATAALSALGGLPSISRAQATGFNQGEHYTVLAKPVLSGDPKKIDVVEFFLFTCPFCNRLETPLNSWVAKQKSDVVFRKEHMIGPGFGGRHQQFFYTLVAMGIQKQVTPAMFAAIHQENKRPSDLNALTDIAVAAGANRQKFVETFKSFAVKTRMGQSDLLASQCKVEGVPTLCVNGRYVTTPKKAGGNERIFLLLDQLVEQERKRIG